MAQEHWWTKLCGTEPKSKGKLEDVLKAIQGNKSINSGFGFSPNYWNHTWEVRQRGLEGIMSKQQHTAFPLETRLSFTLPDPTNKVETPVRFPSFQQPNGAGEFRTVEVWSFLKESRYRAWKLKSRGTPYWAEACLLRKQEVLNFPFISW